MIISVLDRVENILGKKEKLLVQAISSFPIMLFFKRLLSQTCQKVSLCGNGLFKACIWDCLSKSSTSMKHPCFNNYFCGRLFMQQRLGFSGGVNYCLYHYHHHNHHHHLLLLLLPSNLFVRFFFSPPLSLSLSQMTSITERVRKGQSIVRKGEHTGKQHFSFSAIFSKSLFFR